MVLRCYYDYGHIKTQIDMLCRKYLKNLTNITWPYMCNELRGIMARSTQFPNMITRSTIIYEIVSPGAAGSSIYI